MTDLKLAAIITVLKFFIFYNFFLKKLAMFLTASKFFKKLQKKLLVEVITAANAPPLNSTQKPYSSSFF